MPDNRERTDDRSSYGALEEPYPETGRRAYDRHPNDPQEADYGNDPPRGGVQTVERVASAVAGIAGGVTEGLARYRDERQRFATRDGHGQGPYEPTTRPTTPPRASGRRNGTMVRHRIRSSTTRLERFRGTLARMAGRVRTRAEDVQDAARRSRGAGSDAMDHVGDAMRAEVRAKGMSLSGYLVAGVVGIITLVLLSAGSVVAFNLALGTPWGWFITAGIYAAVGVTAIVVSQLGAERSDHTAHEEMDAARRSVRQAVAPLRRNGNGGHRAAERERYETATLAPRR